MGKELLDLQWLGISTYRYNDLIETEMRFSRNEEPAMEYLKFLLKVKRSHASKVKNDKGRVPEESTGFGRRLFFALQVDEKESLQGVSV